MAASESEKLTRRYRTALRKHATSTKAEGLSTAALKAADKLGCEASQLKLGAMDLAQMHMSAWEAMIPADGDVDDAVACRAECFFRHTLISYEAAGGAACPGQTGKGRKPKAVCDGLGAARDRLKVETDRRKTAEAALKDSIKHHDQLLAESNRMQEQLRHLSHQILLAQEEERKRISRELHDEISQVLATINVRLATLKVQAVANTGDLKRKIANAQRMVEKSVAAIHRFAAELRPAMLDDLGLVPTLQTYVKEFEKRSGLQTRFSPAAAEQFERLNSMERTVLYRIAQESLTNVAKHAKASLVTVSLAIQSDVARMSVIDNGKSFNVDRVYGPKQRKRLGIIGMRERAEMVGGALTIDSLKGKGTTVSVHIPLRKDAGDE